MKIWRKFRNNALTMYIVFMIFMIAVNGSGRTTEEKKIENEMVTATEKVAPFIEVYTEKGIVTLCGKVETVSAKEQAEKIATAIPGTRAVVNMISVQPIERPDAAIKQDVVKAFGQDSLLEDCKVVVH